MATQTEQLSATGAKILEAYLTNTELPVQGGSLVKATTRLVKQGYLTKRGKYSYSVNGAGKQALETFLGKPLPSLKTQSPKHPTKKVPRRSIPKDGTRVLIDDDIAGYFTPDKQYAQVWNCYVFTPKGVQHVGEAIRKATAAAKIQNAFRRENRKA